MAAREAHLAEVDVEKYKENHIGVDGNRGKLSHEKNPPTFHYTGWLIGILIMAYYNPYITG